MRGPGTDLPGAALHPRADAVALLTEARRALATAGRVLVLVLVTEFGNAGLLFPRGWATRGFTVIAEVLSGPTHAGNAVAYLRQGASDHSARKRA